MSHPSAASRSGGGTCITGATGFLGAFLLHELLEQTDGPLFCLVRASDPVVGLQRLLAAQVKYALLPAGAERLAMSAQSSSAIPDTPAQRFLSRVQAIPGELARPGLGISPELSARVVQNTQLFLHVAASTNFLFGAPFLRGPNLEGTRGVTALAHAASQAQAAHLALEGGRVRLHYVSSASIFLSGCYGGRSIQEDHEPLEGELRPAWGYQLTKWQGEGIVREAEAAGVAVGISRPWFIGPHSRTGVASDHDFMLRLILTCRALKMAPALELTVNIMPVDWVARALVRLALSPEGGTWYLGNPNPTLWAEVVAQLQAAGPIQVVPYETWRAALKRSPESPAWIFLPLLPEQYDAGERVSFLRRMCRDCVPEVRAPRTQALLAGLEPCPPFHGGVLARYLDGVG